MELHVHNDKHPMMVAGAKRQKIIELVLTAMIGEAVSREVIVYCLRSNVLWCVTRYAYKSAPQRVLIECHTLHRQGDAWGFSTQFESAHPESTSCPLAYLEMAEATCETWRRAVIAASGPQPPLVAAMPLTSEHWLPI